MRIAPSTWSSSKAWRGRGPVELRALPKNCILQSDQGSGGIDTQLIAQELSQSLIGTQSITLATAPIESEDQLRPECLPEWLVGQGCLELSDHQAVASTVEIRLDPQLEHRLSPLLESRPLGERIGHVADVGQGWPSPQPEGGSERVRRLGGAAGFIACSPPGRQLLEPADVDPGGVNRQRVATARFGQRRTFGTQGMAEPPHQRMQAGQPSFWELGPQVDEQAGSIHAQAGGHRQTGQQGPLQRAG